MAVSSCAGDRSCDYSVYDAAGRDGLLGVTAFGRTGSFCIALNCMLQNICCRICVARVCSHNIRRQLVRHCHCHGKAHRSKCMLTLLRRYPHPWLLWHSFSPSVHLFVLLLCFLQVTLNFRNTTAAIMPAVALQYTPHTAGIVVQGASSQVCGMLHVLTHSGALMLHAFADVSMLFSACRLLARSQLAVLRLWNSHCLH